LNRGIRDGFLAAVMTRTTRPRKASSQGHAPREQLAEWESRFRAFGKSSDVWEIPRWMCDASREAGCGLPAGNAVLTSRIARSPGKDSRTVESAFDIG